MNDAMDELKAHARRLHRAVAEGQGAALARMRALPVFRTADDETLASTVKRADAFAALARELGFRNWAHAVAVLRGDEVTDRGTWLYAYGHFNVWSASYEEAAAIREEHGGFLLPYRHQFVIVDEDFIETVGLDPKSPEWDGIGRDWVRPRDRDAHGRLVLALVRARLGPLDAAPERAA